jgi:hypothetical protein
MLRVALGLLAAGSIAIALAGSCSPATPKPLDVSSYPSASTSAEALFISNMPTAAPSAPAPSASASVHVPDVADASADH